MQNKQKQKLAKKAVCKLKFGLKDGFTLPEVIISFSILILVITAATGVLVTVIRSNNDNVSNLVAYGLAQEGLEVVRFVRDSDAILGLGFDGGTKNSVNVDSIWGAKLFDSTGAGKTGFFSVDLNQTVETGNCSKTALKDCLPVHLRTVNGDLESLKNDISTKVFKKTEDLATENTNSVGNSSPIIFYQSDSASDSAGDSGFHRFIRIEPISSKGIGGEIDKLRVSAVVSWVGQNALNKNLVLTSELTNWK